MTKRCRASSAAPGRRGALRLVAATVLAMVMASGEAIGETAQERRAAVLEQAEAGVAGIPAITAALDDPSALVRRTAMHALARMSDAAAHEAMKGALDHEDAEVRRLAMQGLGWSWVMRHHLTEALSDADPVVRNWIALELGRQPLDFEHGFQLEVTFRFNSLPEGTNASLVRKWESAADERSFLLFYRAPHLRFSVSGDGRNADSVRSGGIEADVTYHLTAVFDPADDTGPGELRMTLAQDDRSATWTQPTAITQPFASDHAIAIGSGAFDGQLDRVSLVPANIERYIAGDTPQQRRATVLAHAERGQKGIITLEAGLNDASRLVRRTAAHALGKVRSAMAHEVLQAHLDHDDPEVRRLAMSGLGRAWVMRHHLAEALSDADPVVKNWARQFLGQHPPDHPTLWESAQRQLEVLLDHDDALVRYQAVMLCGHWDEAPQRFQSLLEAAAGDEDSLVREAAQRVMWPFERTRQSSRARYANVPLALAEEIPLPAEGWRFRTEQQGEPGHLRDWYAPDFDDSDWDRIAIEQFWGEAGYEGYVGVGWYRRAFEAPSDAYDAAELHFGAVDESAWVWLNGEYASQHDIGAAGWDTPFSMDVTDLIQWGRTNHITVRARNTMAAGGIHKPIVLRLYERQDR